MSNEYVENWSERGSGWVLMDADGSVWVRMVPGDLFQGFLGPKPLKNIEKVGLGVLGVGGPLQILTYMAPRPAYSNGFPPFAWDPWIIVGCGVPSIASPRCVPWASHIGGSRHRLEILGLTCRSWSVSTNRTNNKARST